MATYFVSRMHILRVYNNDLSLAGTLLLKIMQHYSLTTNTNAVQVNPFLYNEQERRSNSG